MNSLGMSLRKKEIRVRDNCAGKRVEYRPDFGVSILVTAVKLYWERFPFH